MSLIPILGCDTCSKEASYAVISGEYDPDPYIAIFPLNQAITINKINYCLRFVLCTQCSANYYSPKTIFYKLYYLFPFNDPSIFITPRRIPQNNDPTPEILTLET